MNTQCQPLAKSPQMAESPQVTESEVYIGHAQVYVLSMWQMGRA